MASKPKPVADPEVEEDFDPDRFGTPREAVKLLDAYWPEGIGLDPCWDEDSLIRPHLGFCLRPHPQWGTCDDVHEWGAIQHGTSGLDHSWGELLEQRGGGRWGTYGNIPYSFPKPWAKMAAIESRLYPHIDIVLLMRVAVGTVYWGEHIWPHYSAIGFVASPRLRFTERGKPSKHPGKYDHVFVQLAGREAVRAGAVDRFRATIGRRCVKVLT